MKRNKIYFYNCSTEFFFIPIVYWGKEFKNIMWGYWTLDYWNEEEFNND